MAQSSSSKRYLAGLAILELVTGCAPDGGGGPATTATGEAGGSSAAANDFGGSGVVLNSSIAPGAWSSQTG